MISNYEIRENSLTKNSVFLLLVKADEKGRDSILKELSSFCNLINTKVKGFNYVFELSGITDDSMLEKLRGRLDFISSSGGGVTQTFGNSSRTETIDIATTHTGKDPLRVADTGFNQQADLEGESSDKAKSCINLAKTNTNFSVEQTNSEDINFKEVTATSSLISGDEKGIEIGGSSLKLAQTIPTMKQEIPNIAELSAKEEIKEEPQKKPELKRLSSVEEENKTIISYSNDEMKDVSMTIENPKPGLFRNIFGKIKSAVHSKKSNKSDKKDQQKKEKAEPTNVKTQEQSSLSSLIQETNQQKQEEVNNFQEETLIQQAAEANPFQNLGEGIIVKKSLMEEENSANLTNRDKQELSVNSVTARLQVDDIFAAETVCDFYASQPEGQNQDNASMSNKKETRLDMLKKPEETTKGKKTQADAVPNLHKKEETSPVKVENKKPEIIHKVDSTSDKAESTELSSPNQIFTQSNVQKEEKASSPERGKISSANQKKEEGNSVSKKEKEKATSKKEKKKEVKEKVIIKKEEKITEPKIKKEIKQVQKQEMKDKNKQEEKKEKEQKIEQGEDKMETLSEQGNKNMEEEKQQNPVTTDQKAKTVTNNGTLVQNNKVTVGTKIDHTLHIATPAKEANYRNYPIEMPLIPTYTFANMDISSIRFAHAMAMATLDDLGRSNNPFLLQGPSGTGKTHFLHAMGYEISRKIPQAKILFTNGVRLSRGVQYLLERGQQNKLDEFFNNAEVLIVDDIHLTAVNEHNREYISQVLNKFLKDKKQIVLSSKYPPESLKRFEELVNFKFSTGTIAELKVPSKTHFVRLTNKIVAESFLDLTEAQVQSFFCDQNDSLGDVARNVKRVKVLSRRIESSGIKKLSYEEILNQMVAINGENEDSEISKKEFSDITALERNKESSWGNFGFFFPASQIDKFRWVAFAAQEAAKELGIKGGFNYALKSSYSTEHIISAAFKIANICDLKGLKGAVLLGPSFLECQEPIRDNFYDILTHMLEVMMIRCGTINFEDIKKPSAYIKMLGDILK